MIVPPATWVRHGGANLMTVLPPSSRGHITVYDRLVARRFRHLVDALLEGDAFRLESAGAAERFTTTEGEHAAWIALTGAADGDEPARRWIGAVLLDEAVAVVDATSVERRDDELVAQTARWMLETSRFGLGLRARRFRYRAPRGWLGLPAGLTTTWYPPEFPRRRSMLVVHPAEPSADSASDGFAQLLADERRRGFMTVGAIEDQNLLVAGGLAGRHVRCRGWWPHDNVLLERHVIVLTDGRHRYVLRLESDAAAGAVDAEVLAGVARSVEPVPRRAVEAPRALAARAPAPAHDHAAPWSE